MIRNKRAFNRQITTSDAFIEMPVSSQLLYFHLNMEADDDGFVGNIKRIIKMIGSNEDDLKILIGKRFLLTFEGGVIVIKHWLIHNAIRKDMYQETKYLDEKKLLQIKDNGAYTEVRNESVTASLQECNRSVPQSNLIQSNLIQSNNTGEKISQDKNFSKEIKEVIDLFGIINKNNNSWFENKTQREDIKWLLESFSLEKVKKAIYLTKFCFKDEFYPSIGTPHELRIKWVKMKKFYGSKEIKDRRFIQDFERYMIDLEKEKYKSEEKVKIEKTIAGRSYKLTFNKINELPN